MTKSKEAEKKALREILLGLKAGKSIYRRALWCLLNDRLGFIDADGDDSALRKLVVELRKEGLPVGSSPARGYFVIHSQADYDDAVKMYKSKIIGLNCNMKRLKINAERTLGVQIQMPLIDEPAKSEV